MPDSTTSASTTTEKMPKAPSPWNVYGGLWGAARYGREEATLENKINELIDQRSALISKIPNLQGDDKDQAMKALTGIDSNLREIYHPQKNPGAIEKFGHLLTDHLGIKREYEGKKQPLGDIHKDQTAKKSAAYQTSMQEGGKRDAERDIAAGPLTPEQAGSIKGRGAAADNLSYMQATLQNLKTTFPEAAKDPAQVMKWQNELAQAMIGGKPIAEKYFSQLIRTKDEKGVEHYWRVPMDPNEDPEEVSFDGQKIVPKNLPHPSSSKFGMNVEGYKRLHNIPEDQPLTPEQLNYVEQQIALSSAAPSTNVTTSLKQDANGAWIPVTESNQHIPGFGTILKDPLGEVKTPTIGSGKSSTAPKQHPTSAVKGKNDTTPTVSGGGHTKIGEPLFQGATSAIKKALTDVVDARKLAHLADQVAAKPHDAINQKRLAVQLERASAGRFTVQALDYIIKAGWGNTLEQWKNNPTTGELPTDIVRQLVDGAHENLKAAEETLRDTVGTSGAAGDDSDIDAIIKGLNKHEAP